MSSKLLELMLELLTNITASDDYNILYLLQHGLD